MGVRIKQVSFFSSAVCRYLVLLLAWLSGSFLGFLVFSSAREVYVSLMRSALDGSVSIVGVLISLFFPLLITALAVFFSRPALLIALCACEAFLSALFSSACYAAFGSGGWLLRGLLMFGVDVSLIVLWCLWIHTYCRGEKPKGFVFFICGAFFLVLCVLECLIIL